MYLHLSTKLNCTHVPYADPMDKVVGNTDSPSPVNQGSDNQDDNPTCTDSDCALDDMKFKKLEMSRKMGVLELSPDDEVEGELIYLQNKLFEHTISSKSYCGPSLPSFC